ncbi:MAG TPA: CHAT domain-containing protein, partial [Candidatus Polarisedimenticolia bacterium]|nr:CHAT domain-containing protein [Candidatus Polarisedimenticolia bacterium]
TGGAGSVLATQWPVSDRATARFMDEFYHQLVGTGAAATALAQAQRASLSKVESRSPFYWAGFALSGGREAGT